MLCRALSFLLLATPLAHAQFAPAPFLIGGEHQLSSDIDGGGSFSRSSIRLRGSAPIYLGEETFVGLSASYEYETFDFDDLAIAPWEDLHRTRLALVAKSDFGDGWSWIAIPWLASNIEEGADFGESLNYGGLGGVWYNYNDRLSVGLGIGLGSNLEDDLSVFPLLLINWKITDTLTFSTAPPEGFRIGPGATLRWDAREDLSLSLIYQYQSSQQRLDEDSLAAANGVGEFRQHRVALAATYRPNENLSLTAHVGLGFQGELEVQNSSGRTLEERDFDSSFVFGLEGSIRF